MNVITYDKCTTSKSGNRQKVFFHLAPFQLDLRKDVPVTRCHHCDRQMGSCTASHVQTPPHRRICVYLPAVAVNKRVRRFIGVVFTPPLPSYPYYPFPTPPLSAVTVRHCIQFTFSVVLGTYPICIHCSHIPVYIYRMPLYEYYTFYIFRIPLGYSFSEKFHVFFVLFESPVLEYKHANIQCASSPKMSSIDHFIHTLPGCNSLRTSCFLILPVIKI